MQGKIWFGGMLVKLIGSWFRDGEGVLWYHAEYVATGITTSVSEIYLENYTGEWLD